MAVELASSPERMTFPFKSIVVCCSLLVFGPTPARAQGSTPRRDPHDSITVTTLTFPGATSVSTDDLKRLIFTRPSNCRLPFLIPICKHTLSQLITDRRRTTESELGHDITKLRVYFWQRGFRSAQVDTVLTPESKGTAVAFRVVEGEATRVGAVTVTQRTPVFTQAELDDIVLLHQGEPFSIIALDSTVAHIKASAWNKGYADVRVDTTVPRPDAQHMVAIGLAIDPRWVTRVARVDFEGNAYMSSEVLRHGVTLQPGTLYTRDAVLESQKRLFQSPALVRAVVITPTLGDSNKIVVVDVSETAKRHGELTVGFNTIDYGQASVLLRLNSLGNGRWLSLKAAAGNILGEQLSGRGIFQQALADGAADDQGYLRPTYQATVTLAQPWIGSARTNAAISAYAGRRSLSNVVIDDDVGGRIGVVHDIAVKAPVGASYRFERTRVQGSPVYFCAGFGVCDAPTRNALTRWQRLSPVVVSGWIDRSDDLEVPTSGYTAVVDAEHASGITGSTFAHNRVSADGSFYHALGSRKMIADVEQTPTVLAFHARAGFAQPLAGDRAALGTAPGVDILHPRARFYAGGMQSVRGYAENELGPTVLQVRRSSLIGAGCTDSSINDGSCDPSRVPSNEFFARPVGGSVVVEGTAEARLPIGKALMAVGFVDGAWVGVNGLSSPAKAKGAVTPGGGFRYRSPLGILRIDFGIRQVNAENLPVVVSSTDAAGNESVIRLLREKNYSPIDPDPGLLRSIGRRIVVHFAMGQAF